MRRTSTRLRLDDGEYIHKILPISPQPSHLLGRRGLDGFLPGIYMCMVCPEIRFNLLRSLSGIDMVFRKARRCPRLGCSRIVPRRCHFSHHGRSSDPRSRLRLGNADLRLLDIGTACLRKFDGALSSRAIEAPVRPNGLRASTIGAGFLTFDPRDLLLLL